MSTQQPGEPLPASQFPTSVGAPPGPVVLGGNELKKRVGQGGMGEVWLAFDQQLHRNVALKTMRPDWAKSPDAVARFYTEARSVAKLNHPNIVQIYQIGDENGLMFFTMEWVDGESLDGLLKRRGIIPLAEALDYTAQMAEGLKFAHENQVIHRDVKPANCLLDKQGRLKIADFGLAKMMDADTSLTSTGVSMGSPNFMSPEMAKGEPADHRADMYALGLTLYQMLTGELAFSGPTATAILLKQVNEEMVITDALVKRAGVEVIGLMKRLAAKRPEQRFETYDALLKVLRPLAERARNMGPQALATGEERTVQIASVGDREVPSVLAGHGPDSPLGRPTMLSPAPFERPSTDTLNVGKGPPPDSATTKERRSATPLIASIVFLVVLGGSVGVYMATREKATPAPAVGTTTTAPATGKGRLIGQVTVTGIPAAEMAGQKVFLYGDAAREQLLAATMTARGLRQSVQDQQRELATRLKALREAGALITSRREAADKLEVARRDYVESQTRGTTLFNQVERLKAGADEVEKNLADFKENGYSNLPVTNPLDGRVYNMTINNNGTEPSIQRMNAIISATRKRIAELDQEMTRLKPIHDQAKEQIASLEEELKLSQTQLAGMDLDKQRAEFRDMFPALAEAQRLLLAEEEKLAVLEPAGAPVATADVSATGDFTMPNLPPADYVAMVRADLKSPEAADRTVALWIQPAAVLSAEELKIALSGSNALMLRNLSSRRALAMRPDPADLERGLNMVLRPIGEADPNLPLVQHIRAVLEE